MRIHRVSKGLAFENRLQVLLGQLERTCDARVDVVTLLKVDVLKEIAAHRPGGNGVAIHIDAVESGNGTLNWHQSLAEVLINGEFYFGRRHKNDSVRRFPVHILGSPMGTIELYGSQVSLPSTDRLLDALNSFQTALTWPEALQRIQALLERGLQRKVDFENRWPEVLGTLVET